MPLTKRIDFNNGVVAEAAYIIISNLNLDFVNKNANITIKTYLNQEVKEQGLETICPDEQFNVGHNVYQDMNLPNTVNRFAEFFLTGDMKINAENYLKTLPNFQDCTIII